MVRKIIVASGVGLRDNRQGQQLIGFLNDNADFNKKTKSLVWTYPKGSGAKVKFEVSVVFTAEEFAKALDTVDAYVVYSGHSRLGQGPAFGPAGTPDVPDKKDANPWGVHFRMGYDATYSEAIGDLLQHSVTPEEYDLTKAPDDAFLPKSLRSAVPWVKEVEDRLKKRVKLSKNGLKDPCTIQGSWRAFDTCQAALAKTVTARKDMPLAGRHYYNGSATPKDFYVSVKVGSADLAAVSLKCALLFMASCSAFDHYYEPLKRRRQEAKSSCKFMLMQDSSTASHARNFLDLIFRGFDPLSEAGLIAVLDGLHGYPGAGMIIAKG
jgi:hypothetical protein